MQTTCVCFQPICWWLWWWVFIGEPVSFACGRWWSPGRWLWWGCDQAAHTRCQRTVLNRWTRCWSWEAQQVSRCFLLQWTLNSGIIVGTRDPAMFLLSLLDLQCHNNFLNSGPELSIACVLCINLWIIGCSEEGCLWIFVQFPHMLVI